MKLFLSAAVLGIFAAVLVAQEPPSQKSKPVSFSKDVFPLIKKRCLPCHASDSENPSLLIMEDYDGIVKGGKHGTSVIPRKGDASLLVQKLQPSPPFGDQMPLMTKKKLTDEEIDLIKKWIDQGAKRN